MAILDIFKSFVQKGKTLYFPGCTTRAKLPHIAQNYEALLKAIGINVVTLKDTVCCGGFCLDAGYRNDFEQCREKNMGVFTDHQVSRIITSDPFCYQVFKEHYSIQVDFAAFVLAQKMNVSRGSSGTICYHDECFLHNDAGTRKLLEQKGFTLQDSSMQSCGAGGLLPLNNPALARRIAERFIKTCQCDKIVTASPLCYLHLKNMGKDILELSEVL